MRAFLRPAYQRTSPIAAAGRWSLFRSPASPATPADPEFAVRALVRRTGLLFRALLDKECLPLPWRDLVRAARTLELRAELRGGRFVTGFAGEQYALPEAVTLLRATKKRAPVVLPPLAPSDPLAALTTLTPGQRPSSTPARG